MRFVDLLQQNEQCGQAELQKLPDDSPGILVCPADEDQFVSILFQAQFGRITDDFEVPDDTLQCLTQGSATEDRESERLPVRRIEMPGLIPL